MLVAEDVILTHILRGHTSLVMTAQSKLIAHQPLNVVMSGAIAKACRCL